jgi:hypothetical protein
MEGGWNFPAKMEIYAVALRIKGKNRFDQLPTVVSVNVNIKIRDQDERQTAKEQVPYRTIKSIAIQSLNTYNSSVNNRSVVHQAMVALSTYLHLLLTTAASAYPHILAPNLSAQEYLRTTSPNIVLSSEFPTPALHSLWEDWTGEHKK